MNSGGFGTVGYARRLARLGEYSDAVARAMPSEVARFWSVSNVDALALGLFLDLYGREAIVLNIGTFVGVSAMCFAVQPSVARVISVDPNPRIADEVSDKTDVTNFEANYKKLGEARVFDVARAALSDFPEESRKIHLTEGVVGTSQVGVHGAVAEGARKVEVPGVDPSSDELSLVAFVDGLHTDDGVRADLEAVFEASPRAVAILHDCRGEWSAAVRKGAGDFISASGDDGYAFEMVGPMGAGLGSPNMGVVFAESDADEVRGVLGRMGDSAGVARHVIPTELRDPAHLLRMSANPKFIKKAAGFGASVASGVFERWSKPV
ncbi:MAG: hypothetical protein H0U65_14580 [Rubrobacter sp.]|nr:hypothetical protein [Rubrobacter sp.]